MPPPGPPPPAAPPVKVPPVKVPPVKTPPKKALPVKTAPGRPDSLEAAQLDSVGVNLMEQQPQPQAVPRSVFKAPFPQHQQPLAAFYVPCPGTAWRVS